MSDEIRVGDRFLVEVEVTEVGAFYAGCLPAGGLSSECFSLAAGRLHASKRLPRALKVGDRVLVPDNNRRATITAIHGQWAWCHDPDSPNEAWRTMGFRFGLSALTLSEEPTP